MEDYWNFEERDDDFNPEDHGIENDEVARLYAMADMKEEHKQWVREQAEIFYSDFEDLEIPVAISAIKKLVNMGEVKLKEVNLMLENMISVFEEEEEYERCGVCKKIKNGLNVDLSSE